ncbi:MAG: phosphatase PAP2 family protein [Clostridiales bacterium]|nr:phosphatase PAP2 family protein [Clostridiales bacterium]
MDFQAFLSFDRAVFEWFERVFFDTGLGALATPFFKFVTYLGEGGVFWILLGLLLMVFKKTRKCGFAVLGALVCMMVINNLALKNIIARTRPFNLEQWRDWFVYPEIVPRPSSFSFPSGHSSSAFAAATATTSSKKPYIYIPAFILAALIGCSRIYVHVHYCTDVLFGALFGIIYGLIGILVVSLIIKLIKKHRPENGSRLKTGMYNFFDV